MVDPNPKAALRSELLAQLAAALDSARLAYAAAIEGATHPEARAENDKDTRGLEQSYLARGQAQRVAELEAAVSDVGSLKLRDFAEGAAIAMSALVTVGEGSQQHRYFVAPAGGGTMLAGDVQVVTAVSPIGRALIGKRVDDEIELALGGKTRAFDVLDIE